MGQQQIQADGQDESARRRFARAVLDDLTALERMIAGGLLERGTRRIGAEQELFLVDETGRPASLALPMLERLDDRRFTTELAQFNLEFNLPPCHFGGECLAWLEATLDEALARARDAARGLGGDVLLAGILPSLELTDLTLDRMTPLPRYAQLNRTVMGLSGGEVRTLISGADELQVVHDNVMLEACNTSFQIHWQTAPDEFPALYNLAQLIAAPVLAAAANSPLLLQHRLWHESRIALFQQSLDFRSVPGRLRGTWQRVSFGHDWVRDSALEIYRDQVARHGVLLAAAEEEPSTVLLERGEIPPLRALSMHNGTVYRWNRACYGLTDGVPHLRIEHRPLPSGPTVLDEVANAALFFGLMAGSTYGDVREAFRFSDVKANFQAAARYGLKAGVRWTDREVVPVRQLLLEELLPMARAGLRGAGVPAADVSRYLGVIEERVREGRNGAQWQLDAFERLAGAKTRVVRAQAVVRETMRRQWTGDPVARWTLPDQAQADWRDLYDTVGQVMTTDLFTVRPSDLVDVAASVMQWKHVRHVPVESDAGELVGLLSYRSLLRVLSDGLGRGERPVPVRDIMQPEPVTTRPDARCIDAIRLMKQRGVSCLPVVLDGRLVGIVSERDFLELAYRLYEHALRDEA